MAPVGAFEPNMCADVNSEMCTALVWFVSTNGTLLQAPQCSFVQFVTEFNFTKQPLKCGVMFEWQQLCVFGNLSKLILSDGWQERG